MLHFKHTILLNFGQLRIIASCKYMVLEISMPSKTISYCAQILLTPQVL